MGLRELLGWTPTIDASVYGKAAAAPEPPWIDLPCPGCGSTHFRPGGGQQVRPRTNGARFRLDLEAALLTCLACGRPWYTTEQGLKPPHADALSADPAGLEALIQKAREGAAVRPGAPNGAKDESRPKRRVTGPHEGFMLPPKVS